MRGHRKLLALACACLAMPAAGANAAPRVEILDLPSAAGNVDLARTKVNHIVKLQARVVLPDGYDAQPGRRWPVLYLLHGGGDDSSAWLNRTKGDVLRRAAGLGAIIVMPEGGQSYYTDHWLGGTRKGGNWERYELEEVLPAIEARYRISTERGDRAIGGLSMGAFGTIQLAAQLPSYFGTAIVFSGVLNLERPETERLLPPLNFFSYTRMWGPYRGDYVRAHNPMRLVDNLRRTRLYVATGNGITDRTLPLDPAGLTSGAITEYYARWDALRFADVARRAGVDVTYRAHTGVHAWPYWRRFTQEAVAWGPFSPAANIKPADRGSFIFRTMAPRGNAWGLGFRFTKLPTALMALTRAGQHLSATGTGEITITPGAADADATGAGTRADCAFTATLPFERELPAGC